MTRRRKSKPSKVQGRRPGSVPSSCGALRSRRERNNGLREKSKSPKSAKSSRKRQLRGKVVKPASAPASSSTTNGHITEIMRENTSADEMEEDHVLVIDLDRSSMGNKVNQDTILPVNSDLKGHKLQMPKVKVEDIILKDIDLKQKEPKKPNYESETLPNGLCLTFPSKEEETSALETEDQLLDESQEANSPLETAVKQETIEETQETIEETQETIEEIQESFEEKQESFEEKQENIEMEPAEVNNEKVEDLPNENTDALDCQMESNSEDGSTDAGNSGSLHGGTQKNPFRRRRPMEEPDSLICQLCNVSFEYAHELTLHIRGHNAVHDHTCNICGKKLSSGSSLDRHMLIHSGERPFKCRLCPMSFTTNGNMNRHLRTHEKGSRTDGGSDYKSNQNQTGKAYYDADYNSHEDTSQSPRQSPHKRMKMYFGGKASREGTEDELSCSVCHKTFLCRFGRETHMTFHPDMALNCVFCSQNFRNQRGLRMHLYKVHKKDSAISSFSPDPKNEKDLLPKKTGIGLDELSFTEFSNKKFPFIAQMWCEENAENLSSISDYNHICKECKMIFPCTSALNLHITATHNTSKIGWTSIKQNRSKLNGKGKVKLFAGLAESYSDSDLSSSTSSCLPGVSSKKKSFFQALQLKPSDKLLGIASMKPSVINSPMLNGMLDQPLDQVLVMSPTKMADEMFGLEKKADQRKKLWRSGVERISGRPMIPHLSPLKGAMASDVPNKSSVEVVEGSLSSSNNVMMTGPAHGPLARMRDDYESLSGPVTASIPCHSPIDLQGSTYDDDMDFDGENSGDSGSEEKSGCHKRFTHICKFCGKAFPFRSTLKVHVRSHMGLTPYKCMLCDYSSADKSTLVRHMRTHSGERPYSCKICSFPFTTKANCERHVRKRHAKTAKLDIDYSIEHHPLQKLPEQGQFSSPDTVCKVCNRDFKFFRDLQNHMRIHENSPAKLYGCMRCNMNFAKKNQCVRHMLHKHRKLSSEDIEKHFQNLRRKSKFTRIARKKSRVIKEEPKSPDEAPKQYGDMGVNIVPYVPATNAPLPGLPRPVPIYVSTGFPLVPFEGDTQQEPLDLSLPKKGSSPPQTSPSIPSISYSAQHSSYAQDSHFTQSELDGALKYKESYRKFYSPVLDSLVCPHCCKLFKKGSRLKSHIRSHTFERPFRCSACHAAFTDPDYLEDHIARRHPNDASAQALDMSEVQSVIAKTATPMQIKLKHRSMTPSSILKFCLQKGSNDIDASSDRDYDEDIPLLENDEDKPQSPANSESEASIDLASVSNMLAATDANNFQQYLTSQFNRSGLILLEHPSSQIPDGTAEPIPYKVSSYTKQTYNPEINDENVELLEDQTEFLEDSVSETSLKDKRHPEELSDRKGEIKNVSRFKLESKQVCPYCQRKFPWISSLRRHLITHTGLKPYECPHCGANFSTKSNCERHINRRHQSVSGANKDVDPSFIKEPYRCKECSTAAFSTRRKLQKHYKEDHPGADFPQEYLEAPDVIINNKELIERIQAGHEPLLSSEVINKSSSGGTKKRNQIIFPEMITHNPSGLDIKNLSPSLVNRQEPSVDQEEENESEDVDTCNKLEEEEMLTDSLEADNEEYLEREEGLEARLFGETGELEEGEIDNSFQEIEEGEDTTDQVSINSSQLDDSDFAQNEDEEDDDIIESLNWSQNLPSQAFSLSNSFMGDHVTSDASNDGKEHTSASRSMPRISLSPRKGKKGARFSCTQCCKRFKTAQTLYRHQKIHQLAHPFPCTVCNATFTTKFNCQRHIMKLHGKSRHEVVQLTGYGRAPSRVAAAHAAKQLHLADTTKLTSSEMATSPNVMQVPVIQSNITQGPEFIQSLSSQPLELKKSKSSPSKAQLQNSLHCKSPSFLTNATPGTVLISDFNFNSQHQGDEILGSTNVPDNLSSSNLSKLDAESNSPANMEWGYNYDNSPPSSDPFTPTEEDKEELGPASETLLQTERETAKDSDIIQNLLGLQDSSTIDQLFESADSAAKILGVQG